MKKIVWITLLLVFIFSCNQKQPKDKGDKTLDNKVESLLSKMTLKQKLGQMSQLNFWTGGDSIPVKFKKAIRKGEVGSFLNAEGVSIRNSLQRIAVEESELGIPLIFGRDVIHGFRTLLPIPIGQSCSWNPDLIKEGARVAAKEASAGGYDWTFAPMIDITRNPKWGRVAETCGEDPWLTSQYAEALVQGFQGDDLSDPKTIAACAKHYVGYGETEDGKDYNTTWIPEIKLRNLFLPPFKTAIDAGVATIMSAFNDLNGVPTSGNVFTLKTILREEWGYDGMVVSDWDAITQMVNHGYAKDNKDAAYKGIRACIDMEMHSKSYITYIEELMEEGKVSQKMVDDAVRNILKLKYKLGLFENPYTDTTRKSDILSDENLEVARKITRESMVLLKNDNNVLPFGKDISKVALIGPLADAPEDQKGCWAFDGKAEEMITPLQAFNEIMGEENVFYAAGLKSSRDKNTEGFANAVAQANKADAVVLIVGEEAILSGEARCRAFLDLPGAQQQLIEKVAATEKPLVLVVMAGRPLVFKESAKLADAVLYAWHPGIMGGPALYDLLYGKDVPSGKLTITFPRAVGQVPIYYSHKNSGRPPSEESFGIATGTPLNPVGYNSHFLDVSVKPAYPFGFGLSYTDFEYSNLKLSSDTITMEQTLTVTATIKNTGDFDAKEVVQFYIRDMVGSATRPVKELKGFQKLFLKSGESKEVSFSLSKEDMAFYNTDIHYLTEPGDFQVWIAPNSADETLKEGFTLIE